MSGGTLVLDVEFVAFAGRSHEGVDAGEVVAVEVVLVEGALDGVIKLWEVVLSNHLIESP
jgi:hypothetical protein